MRRILLFLTAVLAGLLPCKSQDTIVLKNRCTIEGRVAWSLSRGDDLHYHMAAAEGDSMRLCVPRHRVDYVRTADGRRMVYHGDRRGWAEWQGRTFAEVPRQRMQYAVSGGILSAGWSAEAAAMRYLNRANYFGVGGFVRYASTTPSRQGVRNRKTTFGYHYDNRAVSLGAQAEFRGYLRSLRTFLYVQLGAGVSYHRFTGWQYEWKPQYEDYLGSSGLYDEFLNAGKPDEKWAPTVHLRVGFCTRLTRGLYFDAAGGCIVRFIDFRNSEVTSVFKKSDMYPFGLSVGLRFGRESGK